MYNVFYYKIYFLSFFIFTNTRSSLNHFHVEPLFALHRHTQENCLSFCSLKISRKIKQSNGSLISNYEIYTKLSNAVDPI